MRLWSLHPKYLDSKGLVALWREGLLAQHVLAGKTKGYKNHPQLLRFKESQSPVSTIDHYLSFVYEEACQRGYNFNKQKLDWGFKVSTLKVNSGQLTYEFHHLLNKLKVRDKERYAQLKEPKMVDCHPMFEVIKGEIEAWEILE